MDNDGDAEDWERVAQVKEALDAIRGVERTKNFAPLGLLVGAMVMLWFGGVFDHMLVMAAVMPVLILLVALFHEVTNIRGLLLKVELREYLRDEWPQYSKYSRMRLDDD